MKTTNKKSSTELCSRILGTLELLNEAMNIISSVTEWEKTEKWVKWSTYLIRMVYTNVLLLNTNIKE